MTSDIGLAGPTLTVAYQTQAPYALSARCDPAQPLLTVNLVASNGGDTATAARTVTATDSGHLLGGTTTLPAIDPGGNIVLSVPLSHLAGSALPSGSDTISIAVGKRRLGNLDVVIPAAFCAPPSPGGGAVAGVSGSRAGVSPIAGKSPYERTTTSRSSIIAAAVKVAAPNGVRSASGAKDCADHVGLIGGLVCADMIRSGDLLLVWDWQSGAGPDDIAGFRIYSVGSGTRKLVATRADKKDLTLFDLPKPAGGYGGACYAVTAYTSTQESDPSAPFCASGTSAATTVRLAPAHVRSALRVANSGGNASAAADSLQARAPALYVGFSYYSSKAALGDYWNNQYFRGAIAFDVSSLANRRLVSARLLLDIASSDGLGNETSCTTNVGTGVEYWWLNKNWIDGQFGSKVAPTDTGPQIVADVTPLVAPWLHGNTNFGFVLRNDDENLGAFTNKRCQTSYANPILEITYY